MAIARMQKLLLVGNISERKNLIKRLHKSGCVEINYANKFKNVQHTIDEQKLDVVSQNIAKLDFCLDTLNSYKTEAKRITKGNKEIKYEPCKPDGLLKAKASLTFEDLCESEDLLKDEVFSVIDQIGEYNSQIVKIKNEKNKLKSTIDQMKPFEGINCKLSKFVSTKTTHTWLGCISTSKVTQLSKLDEIAVYEQFPSNSIMAVAIVSRNEHIDEVNKVLADVEYVACANNVDGIPKEIIESCQEQLKKLDIEKDKLIMQIVELDTIIPKVRQLYDYYLLEKAKAECEEKTGSTSSSYVLDAWVPTSRIETLSKELEESDLTLAFITRDPNEDENPPTFVESNGVVAPYEDVTNMFSPPSYSEIDPNPYVAFFFFFFFGMMLSDAGYGLLLTLGAGIILAVTKPPHGKSNLIKIMFMGGISTIIWGIIFGSYFGVSAKDIGIWYWFNPIEDPIKMLYLSLGVGIFQMCFGLGLNMASLIKQKKPFEGFCAAFSWYFIIIGIALGALGKKFAPWVPTVGWCILGVGIFLLMLAGALGKKGMKKVSGAFGSLYGIINFFSDLMSYTRIFGLGLATAVIGMVFNQIGMVIYELIPIKLISWIPMVIIFLIGHLFNVGINALGAYVHNSRLQFVEFFGKFYTGGGHLFQPLGSEMKYYYIKKPQEVEK